MAKRDSMIEAYADALQAEHEKTVLHHLANEAEPIATIEELDERVKIMKKAVEAGELVSEASVHLGELVMAFFSVGSDEVEDPQAVFNFGEGQASAAPEPEGDEGGDEPEPEGDDADGGDEPEPEGDDGDDEGGEPEGDDENAEPEPEAPAATGRGRGRGRGRKKKDDDEKAEKGDDEKAEGTTGRGRGRGRRGPLSVVND